MNIPNALATHTPSFVEVIRTMQPLNEWSPTRDELRRALERDELRLHYQPQVHIATNRIVGSEALMRWQHPEHGLLPPSTFIPVAETLGMIEEMDVWALFAACEEAAKWHRHGLHTLRVCVNVSSNQLRFGDFPRLVEKALSNAGLAAQHIELEITETIAIDGSTNALNTLDALAEAGIRISIDDFGTGYANFARLCRLPASRLKLDRSLVVEACNDPNTAMISGTIIELAHRLGLEVTAEGVEREEQLEVMKRQGCDEIQGYYYGRPMASQDFLDHCRRFATDGQIPALPAAAWQDSHGRLSDPGNPSSRTNRRF